MDTGRHNVTRPNICETDATTGIETQREMTDEEYAALIESGWTETAPEENTPE